MNVDSFSSELAAIESAVASVADLLRGVPAETRWELKQELRQELALKLLEKKLTPNGLRVAASNWLLDAFKKERARRETEDDYARKTGKRYRCGPMWGPEWYPPHPDAVRHAWLACDGARMMHVKGRDNA